MRFLPIVIVLTLFSSAAHADTIAGRASIVDADSIEVQHHRIQLAQDAKEQSTIGAWSVAADPRLGRGCFASRNYEDGTDFRIGLNRLTNMGYIAIGSPAWSSLKRGQAYPLRLIFGSAPPRDGRATAVYIDGTMTLWMSFLDADLIFEFMDAPTVQIWINKQLLTELALRGSREAFLEVVRCQAGRQR